MARLRCGEGTGRHHTRHRWVLHAGDSFYYYGTLDGHSRVPRVLSVQESLLAFDRKQLLDNHVRLAELYGRADPDLLIVIPRPGTARTRAVQCLTATAART